MSTQEERLETVEYNLRQFKTETIRAYQDMAFEMTMIKGLTEDTIKRLAKLSDTMENRFERVDTRLDRVESMLAQILARLPEKPYQIIHSLCDQVCLQVIFRRRKYLPLTHNHTPLRPHHELPKRVLHPQQPRRRLRTLKDHIQPVTVPQIACPDILILSQFHIADTSTPLDLDRQFLTWRSP